MAHRIFAAGKTLLSGEADGTRRYRLIGIGLTQLVPIETADAEELFDPERGRLGKAEKAMDSLRSRFGDDAVIFGLSLSEPRRQRPPSGDSAATGRRGPGSR